MVLHDLVHVPIVVSLALILGSIVVGVITSLRATRAHLEDPIP